jgi:hypothetical protein
MVLAIPLIRCVGQAHTSLHKISAPQCKMVKELILLLLIPLGVVACNTSRLDWAKQEVTIGTQREVAIRLLAAEAWYHQPCANRGGIDDLFFYDSRDYNRATVVILSSVASNGIYKVTRLTTFEPNAWHTAYADCIHRDRFSP